LNDTNRSLLTEPASPAGPRPEGRPGTFIRAWLPAFFWLCVIAFESTDLLSAAHTSRILFPFFHHFFGMTLEQFAPINFALRKTGHVFGYGFLSLLLYRGWRYTIPLAENPGWAMVWSRVALLSTAFVATLDEWHQSFLPSRTGTFHDVVLDTAAGVAAQLGLYLFLTRRRTLKSMSRLG